MSPSRLLATDDSELSLDQWFEKRGGRLAVYAHGATTAQAQAEECLAHHPGGTWTIREYRGYPFHVVRWRTSTGSRVGYSYACFIDMEDGRCVKTYTARPEPGNPRSAAAYCVIDQILKAQAAAQRACRCSDQPGVPPPLPDEVDMVDEMEQPSPGPDEIDLEVEMEQPSPGLDQVDLNVQMEQSGPGALLDATEQAVPAAAPGPPPQTSSVWSVFEVISDDGLFTDEEVVADAQDGNQVAESRRVDHQVVDTHGDGGNQVVDGNLDEDAAGNQKVANVEEAANPEGDRDQGDGNEDEDGTNDDGDDDDTCGQTDSDTGTGTGASDSDMDDVGDVNLGAYGDDDFDKYMAAAGPVAGLQVTLSHAQHDAHVLQEGPAAEQQGIQQEASHNAASHDWAELCNEHMPEGLAMHTDEQHPDELDMLCTRQQAATQPGAGHQQVPAEIGSGHLPQVMDVARDQPVDRQEPQKWEYVDEPPVIGNVPEALRAAQQRCMPILEHSPGDMLRLQQARYDYPGKPSVQLANKLHIPVASPDPKVDTLYNKVFNTWCMCIIYQALCQSGKNMMTTVICMMAAMLEVPVVVLVVHNNAEVEANVDTKMVKQARAITIHGRQNRHCRPRQIKCEYKSGALRDWERDENWWRQFEEGRLPVIAPASAAAMKHCYNALMQRNITDCIMILDEGDKCSLPTYNLDTQRCTMPRDKWLVALMTSCCQRVIWMSATAAPTLMLHTALDLPVNTIAVPRERLEDGMGMVTERYLRPVRDHRGNEAWLEKEELRPSKYCGVKSMKVQQELRHFARAAARPGKKGFLMLVALTRRVGEGAAGDGPATADGDGLGETDKAAKKGKAAKKDKGQGKKVIMTQERLARVILRKFVPNAVCVVVNSQQLELWYRGADGALIWEPVVDVEPGENRVGKAIEQVDKRWGLRKPVIVVGYECVGRAVSVRSDDRVLTHLIVAGSLVAANEVQLTHRGSGDNWRTLTDNGHKYIRILCTRADYLMTTHYYDFVSDLLQAAGTGTPEGLARWREVARQHPLWETLMSCGHRMVHCNMMKHPACPFNRGET